MRVGLAFDKTIAVSNKSISKIFNGLCERVSCHSIDSVPRIEDPLITLDNVQTYFESIGVRENSFDVAFMFTQVPYDNNFFYESHDNRFLISLSVGNT